MEIIDLPADDSGAIRQAALMLVEGFKDHWPEAWPTIDTALEEVHRACDEGRINRIAVDGHGTVLGWVGAIREYNGRAWELHPLVVHAKHRGKGIGRALVADLEAKVRAAGGMTIYLGTDDEDSMTTLANKDLYPDVFAHIMNIKNLRNHPYGFYQKLGYAIVGVIPDANGFGKPDIIMAKRVGR